MVDYVLNQYAYRVTNGNVAEWRDNVLAQAKRDGVGIAFSMNILNGGESASRDGGWACPAGTSAGRGTQRAPRTRMTATQIRDWGKTLRGGGLRHADVEVRRRGHGAAGQRGGDARRRGHATTISPPRARFYGELLGCPEGRSADHWVDFDLYGHQIVAHLAPDAARRRATQSGRRRGRAGAAFRAGAGDGRVEGAGGTAEGAGIEFVIPPTVRFAGQPGEQATMFLLDPAGNALEFKAMADPAKLFAKN